MKSVDKKTPAKKPRKGHSAKVIAEISADKSPETFVLALPESLTIHHADLLAEQLRAINADRQGIVLDASSTEILTTPGVQLLLSLDASLKAVDGQLRIVNASEAFVHSLRILGLTAHWSEWDGSCNENPSMEKSA